MSAAAALAAIDLILAGIERVTAVAAIFQARRAAGEEVTWDDVAAARDRLEASLDALDAAIAAKKAEGG